MTAEKPPPEAITVTPAMIDAGVNVLFDCDVDLSSPSCLSSSDVVERIIRAALESRNDGGGRRECEQSPSRGGPHLRLIR